MNERFELIYARTLPVGEGANPYVPPFCIVGSNDDRKTEVVLFRFTNPTLEAEMMRLAELHFGTPKFNSAAIEP